MNKITLQDIIMKKLNNTNDTPDELVNDAYVAMLKVSEEGLFKDKVIAYIKAKAAIQANESCGCTVPELEVDTACLKKSMESSDQEIADFYMEHLDK